LKQSPLTIVRRTLRLPTGRTLSKPQVLHSGTVAILPLLDDGQVVLIRQYRSALDDFLIEIPAGALEEGEDPRRCAERELQEEAGYRPQTLHALGGFYVAPGFSDEYMHLFVAQDLVPSRLEADADELIEVFNLPLTEALRRVESGQIRDAKTIIGLLRVARWQNRGD
jgi:ADP-ribose pyrophosphatase